MSSNGASQPFWPAFARAAVSCAVRGEPLDSMAAPEDNRPHSGVFVTLYKQHQLRGCMGILDPALPRAQAVREAAVLSATQDPRFPQVAADELPDLRIDVSILSTPRPMTHLDDLVLGKHGILIRASGRRGLFLPQVATDHHFDKVTFLSRCCSEKAGLPPDAWKRPGTEVLLFTAEVQRDG